MPQVGKTQLTSTPVFATKNNGGTIAVMAGLTRYIGVSNENGIYLRNLDRFTVIPEKGIQR